MFYKLDTLNAGFDEILEGESIEEVTQDVLNRYECDELPAGWTVIAYPANPANPYTQILENKMKHITNHIRVFDNFAKVISSNGETADKCVTLKIAPEVGGENLYLYLETNGDPVLVGRFEDAGFTYGDSVTDWINDDSFEWLRTALDGYYP